MNRDAEPLAAPSVDQLAERVAVVRHRISDAGGDPAAVTLVAVTKGFGPDVVAATTAVGIADLGENYAQELLGKDATRRGAGRGVRWHFLGPVQRNKVRHLAPLVALWQAVDRVAAGTTIAAYAPGASVLVQVNTLGDPGKGGCPVAAAPTLVRALTELGLDVRGLMAVGPAGAMEGARAAFASLAALADRLGLEERSMGMTGDLEVAVQEGSTMVRVGRALFGPRPDHTDLRR